MRQNIWDCLFFVHQDCFIVRCQYWGWLCLLLMGCAKGLLLGTANILILPPLVFISWQFVHHICWPHLHCRWMCSQHQQILYQWAVYAAPVQVLYQLSVLFLLPRFLVFLPWWPVLLFSLVDKNFTVILIGDDKGFPLKPRAWCGSSVTDHIWAFSIQDINPNFCFGRMHLFFILRFPFNVVDRGCCHQNLLFFMVVGW